MYTPKPQWLKDRENANFTGPKKPWGGYRPGSGRKRIKPIENLINKKVISAITNKKINPQPGLF